MRHSRRYLLVRDGVRLVFWLGVLYGVAWIANLLVPGIFT